LVAVEPERQVKSLGYTVQVVGLVVPLKVGLVVEEDSPAAVDKLGESVEFVLRERLCGRRNDDGTDLRAEVRDERLRGSDFVARVLGVAAEDGVPVECPVLVVPLVPENGIPSRFRVPDVEDELLVAVVEAAVAVADDLRRTESDDSPVDRD